MNSLNRHFLIHLPLILISAYGLVELDLVTRWLDLSKVEAIALCTLGVAAFLWITEWIPLHMTSFVILFLQLMWLVPAMDPTMPAALQGKFLTPFFNDIILLFMGGFVLATALNKYGLDRRIANWILQRTGSSPGMVMAGMMTATAFLSMWMSNTACTAMMFAIVLPILGRIPAGNPFAKGLALAIPFAANLGGMGTPIGTPPNAIAIGFLASKGVPVTFMGWMLATVPFVLVFLVLMWVILMKMFPPGDFKLELPPEDFGKPTLAQHVVMATFVITVLAWFTADFHGISMGTVSLFPLVTLFGLGLLKNQDFMELPWDVLFMVGGGMCLGVGITQSGVAAKFVHLVPVESNFLLVLVAFGLLAAFMTTLMSNTATANLLIPLALSLNHQIGLLVLTVALTCSMSMALPISSPPNAIAFSSGLLEAKDMFRAGIIITLFALVVFFTLGAAYWPMILF